MANLAPKAKVLRDGHWSEQDAAVLAPGDIISLGRAQRAMDGHSHRHSRPQVPMAATDATRPQDPRGSRAA